VDLTCHLAHVKIRHDVVVSSGMIYPVNAIWGAQLRPYLMIQADLAYQLPMQEDANGRPGRSFQTF
jgi:hypothetical protein